MSIFLNYIKNKTKFILSNKFVIIFFFCLFPFSINVFGYQGLSINFIFLLIPTYFFLAKKVFMPPIDLQIIISFYLILFVLHTFLIPKHFIEKFLSFIIFISVFSFTFLKISDKLIKNFKLSIIIFIIIYFIIKLITLFFSQDEYRPNSTTVFSFLTINKGNWGSKYEGIVYLLGLWIIFYHNFKCQFSKLLKFFIYLFIILALYLTFAKASLLALAASLILFSINKIRENSFLYFFTIIKKKKIFIFTMLLLIFIFELKTKSYLSVFQIFINFLHNLNINNIDFEDSTGYRIKILLEVYNLSIKNLLFGSGYLGINSLSASYYGSAHNQYADIFFRTGFFGLFLYLLILYRVLIFLKNYDLSLYYGFFSILIYGFFIETFRLSQVAFILSFILGIYVQKRKKNFNENYISKF